MCAQLSTIHGAMLAESVRTLMIAIWHTACAMAFIGFLVTNMSRHPIRYLSVIRLLVLFSSPNAQVFSYEGKFFSSLDGKYRHMSQVELSTAISLPEDRHGQFSPHLYKPTLRQAENFQRQGEHAAAVNAFRRCQHLVHRADGVYSPTQSMGLT